jgi:O-antigen ligase
MTVLALAAALALLAVALVLGARAPLRTLLPAYAVLVPFGSSIVLPLGLPPPFNTVSTLAGGVATAGIAIHLATSRRAAARVLPAVPVWLAFLGVSALTYFWSVSQPNTVDSLVVLAPLVLLYAVAALVVVERKDLQRVEEGIILGGALTGVYGIFLELTSNLPLTGTGVPRFAIAGGAGDPDPNITAASLLLPLALAVGRGLHARTRTGRVLHLSAAGLIATAITLTGSRGGLLTALVVLAVLAVHERRRSMFLAFGLVAVVATVLALRAAPEDLRAHVLAPGSSGRTAIWKVGLDQCATYCWAGSGWGTFPNVYNVAVGFSADDANPRRHFQAHNIWIRAAVETGVVGLGLVVAGLWLTARELFRLGREARGVALAGFIGVIAANTFLSNLDFKYFWLALMHATLTPLALARASSRPIPAPQVAGPSPVQASAGVPG